MSKIIQSHIQNQIQTNQLLTQLLKKYDKIMYLKIFVAGSNSLKNMYYAAVERHNNNLLNNKFIDAGFDLFLPENDHPPEIEKWDVFRSFKNSLGGTTGFMVTREGASKFLDFVNDTKLINCIDTALQKSANKLDIYYSDNIYSKQL